jgi:hypothetical protein
MNVFVDIVEPRPVKDAEGFTSSADSVLARTRAYKEDRHGTRKWANLAAFTSATALFRFRKQPGLEVVPSLYIVCASERYRILSVEDVRGRGMYIEVLCTGLQPSEG